MTQAIENVEETRKTYDAIGELYDASVGQFNREVAFPRLHALLTQSMGTCQGKAVLDVGAGSGFLVELLMSKGALAQGIELSRNSVDRARKRNLPVSPGTMFALPFAKHTFDAVVSYHSFNYAPFGEQRHVLEEQYRVLKPGGILVLGVFHTATPDHEPRVMHQLGCEFRLYLRTKGELQEILRDIGFYCLGADEPIATPEERMLANETLRPVITGRPYVQYLVAQRIN